MSTVFAIQLLDPLSAILMETAVTAAVTVANILNLVEWRRRVMSLSTSEYLANVLVATKILIARMGYLC